MDDSPIDPLQPTNVFCRRPQQDSDDSENEGGLGNVSRIVMRPAGHSGKAKRGHLCFDASFETGNLGRVDLVSEFEYDLFIRPDTCNPRLRLWFNFTVDNVRADQRVIFNIVNLSKSRNLFRDGMTPIIKSTSRPKWQRMPGTHVYYYRSPEHQNHYVLSFAFGFDREEDVYQFALCFPYSYSRCQAHADALERRHLTFMWRKQIATSLQQRRIDMITITHPHNLRPQSRQRVVCIFSRIHPGESPASFACQGLIDFLVSSHPISSALREHIVFHIVPMLNPDGVFLGNQRSSVMGFDLNRSWNKCSPFAQPALHALLKMLQDFDKDESIDLDFVMDMHAHSSLLGAFIYGNTYDDVYRHERHVVFQKLLAQNAEDFSLANTMYNRDPSKQGSTRRHFCSTLKESVNCYTLEVSLYGFQRPNETAITPYTEDAYFRLGRNVARTFYDYYRNVGVIPCGETVAAEVFPMPVVPPVAAAPRKPASVGSSAPSCNPDSQLQQGEEGRTSSHVLQLAVESRPAEAAGLPQRPLGRRVACPDGPQGVLAAPQPPPSLTIIDFNELTRGGLDVATGRRAARPRDRAARRSTSVSPHRRFACRNRSSSQHAFSRKKLA
ncbi:Hypothetical predicted protein [Cloeon dipterum]|uniref:Peptidase M14 domain-containing protein n=2 Tax=Cloeon dipterum TaxID=197152 RepID=A0A8S1C2L8_9INSE|nr:Hypothetical predicted protein [Cloeon dipterum]